MDFQSKNPVLNGIEQKIERNNYSYVTGDTASFGGIATKTGILLAVIFTIATFIWANVYTLAEYLYPMLAISSIVGFISVIVAGVSQRMSGTFSIIYAVCQGIFLGTISAIVEMVYEGIVFNAILITFAIFGFLLVTYATGIFKVGIRFRKIVYTILFGVVFYYLIAMMFSWFGVNLYATDPTIIALVSVAMIILASFTLMIDIDNCKIAVQEGMSKKYEWYLSLGLLVSLVWLYIEILRLLIIISSHFKD